MRSTLFFLLTGIFLLFSLSTAFSQAYDFEKIAHQTTAYNNEGKYDQTIILLEDVLSDRKATAFDKYQAYFLKYQTYKRLANYEKAELNLNLALVEGLQSDKKEQITAQVKLEKLFIVFDLLQFERVNKALEDITINDLQFVSPTTKAFYFMVLGTMENKKGRFKESDHFYDQAVDILEQHNPQHLPLAYRKKIDVYRQMKQYDKAIESFEKGLAYAKQYNIDFYILNLYFDLAYFYKEIGDLENAVEAQKICNQLAKEYDEGNVVGRLNILENKIMEERIAQEKKKDWYTILYLIGALLLFISLLVVVYQYLNQTRKKKKRVDEENEILTEHLMDLVSMLENTGKEAKNLERLSDRQFEIINLVKQGKTNKEIGNILFISENTVKYHLKNIYDTLSVTRRIEL